MARMIWNNVQLIALTKELLDKDIKHHHAISSAYTEWSLINSGKSDAKKALDTAEAIAKEVKTISSNMDSIKKTASDAANSTKNAKSQADKALSKTDKLDSANKN